MPEKLARETAYFLDSRAPALILIAQGVRFPDGQWIRVADGSVLPWHAEQLVPELFPSLKSRPVRFHALLTDFDVTEYERESAAQR